MSWEPRGDEAALAVEQAMRDGEEHEVSEAAEQMESGFLIPAPEPGVYRDVPEATYFAWDAASSSTLKQMDRSPRFARLQMQSWDTKRTPFRDFGHAVHCAVLEPDQLEERYCARPVVLNEKTGKPWGPTAKAVTEAVERIEAEGLAILGTHQTLDIMETARGIREEIRRCESAALLLESLTHHELSVVALDPVTGVPMKARLDGYAEDARIIAELKTGADTSPQEFSRATTRYGYHNQAALYCNVARWAGLEVDHHIILACDSVAPFDARTYVLEPAALEIADETNRRRLNTFAECWHANHWPGPDGSQPLPLALQRWGYYAEEDTE